MDRRIKTLKAHLEIARSGQFTTTDPRADEEAALIQQQISDLEAKRFQNARTTKAARYRVEGETLSKLYSAVVTIILN